MYVPNDAFDAPPDPSAKVWRYIDFTKLVSLLEDRTLYFAQIERLADPNDPRADPFEGSYPWANVDTRVSDLYPFASDHESEELKAKAAQWTDVIKVMRRIVFVNCWHVNDHESAALWRLYLSSGEGVAIRSTFARLVNCFAGTPEDVHIGLVRYIDYRTDRINPFNYFTSVLAKRRSYEHERELRAVVLGRDLAPVGERLDDHQFPPGLAVSIDLDALIEAIYVAPTAPAWFAGLTEKLLRRYGVPAPVHRSDLLEQPFF